MFVTCGIFSSRGVCGVLIGLDLFRLRPFIDVSVWCVWNVYILATEAMKELIYGLVSRCARNCAKRMETRGGDKG